MQDAPPYERTIIAGRNKGHRLLAWWLVLRVHLDALASAPRTYCIATWWSIRRKRVRARALLAPLLGSSKKAYDLWLMRHSDRASKALPGRTREAIVALIDISQHRIDSAQMIENTLRSLESEGIPAIVIGDDDMPDAAKAADLIEAAGYVWLMPMVAGDLLAHGAAKHYLNAATAGCDIVYADDDLIGPDDRRTSPHFKPGWNSELFEHHDYLTCASIIRASVSNLASCRKDDWARRVVANAVGSNRRPVHIPRILHHRRSRITPRVPSRPTTTQSARLPAVTVIVPTRNRADLLRTCLEGLERTAYQNLEIIVMDNGSDEPATLAYLATLPRHIRVMQHPGPFNFSAMNNAAAAVASGQLLCLLNNDIEIVDADWLQTMAVQTIRDEVGAVGAQLLYPDGRIQHAGVVVGIGGGAAHAHRLLRPGEEGYFHRHALPQFVSAVTAACLVVRRDRYLAAGGLNEADFAVAFNDVDFCLRLNRSGWQTLYEPRAVLIHHESVSRGLDRDRAGSARLAGELAALKALWGTGKKRDPFHHPELSQFSERFVIQV